MTGFESATMVAQAIDDCLVFVHGSATPTDAEWERAMALLARIGPERASLFVWTEGAAPNAAQRAKLAKATGAAKPPIAVLTASPLARAAGTAISWFNPALRMFAPPDVAAALDHLGITEGRRVAVLTALEEMKTSIRITPRDRSRTAR